ncbi:coiled-coil domain-containing protein 33 isoform X1 [Brienomyrus brachyistius]|uniref:coiled-coil domain-containing protein 33 isoform X1 n=3 Tax=Brienomyrus brachyistius TaxID=42636 RepID=UPI0020B3695A|nr:coiled-coil domain-containing protein 33 isoform X1 [Brienomyrus brachyistius]
MMQNKETHTEDELKVQGGIFGLPSLHALAGILQERVNVFGQTQDMLQAPTRQQPEPGHSTLTTAHLPEATSSTSVTEAHAADTERQSREEMENYHRAMNKMAEDILALRRQVSTLNSDNKQLRSRLSLHHDPGRTLLNTDVDVMTKEEIADCIASLEFKLASERDQSAVQRDKIQQMQNELIRKNDCEKMLQQLQRDHQQQQTVIQQYQGRCVRMVDLEATVREQEKVIEKMEQALSGKLSGRANDEARHVKKQTGEYNHRGWEVELALAAENARLRAELEKLQKQPVTIQQPLQVPEPFSDSEKLALLVQLERAQTQVSTLEIQLEENSQKWGREKEELLTRLSEHAHGFAQTAVTLSDSLLTTS